MLYNVWHLYLCNIYNDFISCVRLTYIIRTPLALYVNLHNLCCFSLNFLTIFHNAFDGCKHAANDDPRYIYNHSSSCGFSGKVALAYLAAISAADSCCGVVSCSILIVCESLY